MRRPSTSLLQKRWKIQHFTYPGPRRFASTHPLSSFTASSASRLSSKVTKAKPRDSRVIGSMMTSHLSSRPNLEKISSSSGCVICSKPRPFVSPLLLYMHAASASKRQRSSNYVRDVLGWPRRHCCLGYQYHRRPRHRRSPCAEQGIASARRRGRVAETRRVGSGATWSGCARRAARLRRRASVLCPTWSAACAEKKSLTCGVRGVVATRLQSTRTTSSLLMPRIFLLDCHHVIHPAAVLLKGFF